MSAFACSSCGEPVPIGRLACPSCGELLASVAGSPRRAVARAEAGSAPAEAALAMAAPDAAEPDGWDAPEAMAEVAETPEPVLLADAPVPAGPAPAPEPTFTLAPEPTFTLTPGSAFEPSPAPEPRWPTEAGPAIEPTGAYPPGSEFTSALRDTEPVDPGAPPTTMAAGAGWGGDGSARWSAAVAAADAPASPPREPGVRALRIGLPGLGALPERFAEQLTGIAGAVIGVGFVLPWGERVIGSPQVGAPWWSLGVVGSGSWAVFLAVLGGLALATAGHDRAPAWLRLGAVPLGLGALVIGTAWPYLFGPLGGGIGTTAVAIGALAWIVLGLLAVRPPRHPDATPSV